MEYKCFKYSLEDHIAHVTLSRGNKLNTMIKAFWSELPNLIDEISNNGEARVVLISAEGKHFTAGMDLENLVTPNLLGAMIIKGFRMKPYIGSLKIYNTVSHHSKSHVCQ